ncbi:MAG: hypothetical protein A2136_04300 [Chloroflexi bacterium RBG_16_54_11]|nr:MAG: hypothetical protein A2136_04300 [Chloroflexi bacterium RBG_16_54_11]
MKYEDLYEQYLPRILRFVSAMHGETDSEDLAQEIFIKVSRGLPGFRGESKLSTWLYRIATNTVLDHLRSSASQRKSPSDLEDIDGLEVDDQDIWTGEKTPLPEWQVVRREMSACLQGYIQELPETQRIVLILSEIEGLPNREIADVLGITTGAVKIRLHRARDMLKKALISSCPPYWVEGNEFLPDLGKL